MVGTDGGWIQDHDGGSLRLQGLETHHHRDLVSHHLSPLTHDCWWGRNGRLCEPHHQSCQWCHRTCRATNLSFLAIEWRVIRPQEQDSSDTVTVGLPHRRTILFSLGVSRRPWALRPTKEENVREAVEGDRGVERGDRWVSKKPP
jgi:hypothetical protein